MGGWLVGPTLALAAIALLSAFAGEGQTTPLPPKACRAGSPQRNSWIPSTDCALDEDVRKRVVARGYRWEVVVDGPPMNLQLPLIKVGSFGHLGATGELRLLFFRTRLM